ncbi:MAG: hypothetical protein RLZZ312_572 [Bacteroidota bacterium]
MTIFYIILALLFAAALSFYQYFYKNNAPTKATFVLASLRFCAIFGLLLLLINPIFSRKTFENQKTPLAIIVDNSASIENLKANAVAIEVFKKISENKQLNDKFDVQKFQFDNEFSPEIKIDFKGKNSDFEQVSKNLKTIFRNKKLVSVLISDGNQTKGNDYVYSFDDANKVYPIVLGDTTTFLDLKIGQLNVNKYAFQKNKFPVEVFIQYSGTKNVNATFNILQDKTVVASQNISFSPANKSAKVDLLLPANSIGVQLFTAKISSKEVEKNITNNIKPFAVQVIDERTTVAIVSSINHPDIGALKRSIETNLQRKVLILRPQEIANNQEINVFVLYQPTNEFKSVFDLIKKQNKNYFVITGINTDYNFLNQNQTTFEFRMSNQREDYLSVFKNDFNVFVSDDIGFNKFPPLQNTYGTIVAKENIATLLESSIRNVATNQPLLAFSDNFGKRTAYLFGENSWRWRMQSFVENKNFEKYDVFFDKTIQFLSSNDSKKSLIVNHENFYNAADAIEITAQYFNKNYEFDENAKLTIEVVNKKTKVVKKYDLLKSRNDFKVNLDGLASGQYSFTVKELNSKTSYSSFFEILDFDIEKQFVNPDLTKLKQLADQTSGMVFMPNQVESLLKKLVEDSQYKIIQKEIVKKTPFIEWEWLLVFIASCLTAEWFLRKYRGML